MQRSRFERGLCRLVFKGVVTSWQNAMEAGTGQAKTRVFISYSRKDMAFADGLEVALKARGFEVLIDRQEIYAFEDWWKRIELLIGRADTVVFVLSPDAAKSDVALKEVAYATSLNKRFAPIVCRPVQDSAVPAPLRPLNFIFFDDQRGFDANADQLAEALRTDIGWVRQHTEYGEAERRWSTAGRPRGLLLQSPTLEVAEYWIGSRPAGAPEPTREIKEFVSASRRSARASQRLRRVVAASMFALLIGIILGLVGWINQTYIADQWRWYTVTLPYASSQVWPHVLTAAQEQALKMGDSFKECAQDCPEMVIVPAGSYRMGGFLEVEQPQHTVTIAKPFAVSKYELTFADWDACVSGGGCNGYKPDDKGWGRGKEPAMNVDWDDAQQYVKWLSAATGKSYRLLSEAEYEYAARAGTTTAYPWGDDIKLNGTVMANCSDCASRWQLLPAPVGSFAQNRFGLYDMVGNVWEWVEDCGHKNYNGAPTDGSAWITGGDCRERVVRGGSFVMPAKDLHSSYRLRFTPEYRYLDVGFRVARTLLTP